MNDLVGIAISPTLETANNTILASLAPDERDRLRPHIEFTRSKLGETIFNTGERIDYLYFPNNSIASVIGTTRQGGTAEIGLIGREGIVGLDLLLGARTIRNPVIIQLADGIFRLPADEALREFKRAGAFQDAVLKFTHSLLTQVSQTAVCNTLHRLDERLAKWLLMCRDRAPSDELRLTQEFLALMVGTTRSSVTIAAITLQDLGYIKYSRGLIRVIDRSALIDFACDCYRVVQVTDGM